METGVVLFTLRLFIRGDDGGEDQRLLVGPYDDQLIDAPVQVQLDF